MFGRRATTTAPLDTAAKRFWTWFGAEAEGISNAFEALARGEADADSALDGRRATSRRLAFYSARRTDGPPPRPVPSRPAPVARPARRADLGPPRRLRLNAAH